VSILRSWWLLSTQECSYNLWKPKVYYVLIRSMHRTLFCVTWIKCKILHTCCLRIYYYCKLSVCISSDLLLTFIFTQYNALFILIYSASCMSFPSSCPWFYHHSNICWKLQFMNHTLCNFGLPEWVTRRSTSNTNKSWKIAGSGPVCKQNTHTLCILMTENKLFWQCFTQPFHRFHTWTFMCVIVMLLDP